MFYTFTMANIVTLVGRPNVGKSTLFNRLVQAQKAITSSIPGTTRDRYYDVAEWSGHEFTVIDTGGYLPHSTDIFAQEIREQVQLAIGEASLVLFLVDCKQGLTPPDQDIASILRKSGKSVIVVVNKADSPKIEEGITEFYALGFDQLYSISATHGTGTGDLLDGVVATFNKTHAPDAFAGMPKIAIIGKPNVGKSTFLNALLNQNRSIVTPIAHTTRSPVHTYYDLYGKKLILVDTAGMRKRTQIKEGIEFYSVMRALKAIQQTDVCLLVLSAESGLTQQDKQIIDQAWIYKKGVMIVVNKWDVMSKAHKVQLAYKKDLLRELGNRDHLPILFTSGLYKKRIYQTLTKALELYEDRIKKIATARLNKTMLRVIETSPPPASKGRIVTIKYVTQIPTHTPSFAFFCNFPQCLPTVYKKYLENQLRKHFGFQGIPITIVFKKK